MSPATIRRVELTAGLIALASAVLAGLWLAWWSAGNPYFAIFDVELMLPALIVGGAAYLHAGRRVRWARYVIWVGTALAILEMPAMLLMYPFMLSLAMVIIAAIGSIWSGREPAGQTDA